MEHIGQSHMAKASQIVEFVSQVSFAHVAACKEQSAHEGPTVRPGVLLERYVPKGLTVITRVSTMFHSAFRAMVAGIVTSPVSPVQVGSAKEDFIAQVDHGKRIHRMVYALQGDTVLKGVLTLCRVQQGHTTTRLVQAVHYYVFPARRGTIASQRAM
jgi:hypothetical protein